MDGTRPRCDVADPWIRVRWTNEKIGERRSGERRSGESFIAFPIYFFHKISLTSFAVLFQRHSLLIEVLKSVCFFFVTFFCHFIHVYLHLKIIQFYISEYTHQEII